jgi:DNA helicase IV
MSNKKKTAVDLMKEAFERYDGWKKSEGTQFTIMDVWNAYERAKKIERLQIENAFVSGQLDVLRGGEQKCEDYYLEKYDIHTEEGED